MKQWTRARVIARSRGTIGADVRRANLLAALSLLRDGTTLSSPDLGVALRVNPSTVGRLMAALGELGLVHDAGVSSSGSVGRPARLWRLNAAAGYVIGLSVSLTDVRGVLMDMAGQPSAHSLTPLTGQLSRATLMQAAGAAVSELSSRITDSTLLGVGVAFPGVVNPVAGTLRQYFLMEDAGSPPSGYPVRTDLERALGVPVAIGNDANLAALAAFHHQRRQGALHDDDSIAYYLSSGDPVWWNGLGLILMGKLYSGSNNAAGELLYRRAPSETATPKPRAKSDPRGPADASVLVERRRDLADLVTMALALDPRQVVFGGALVSLDSAVLEALASVLEDIMARFPHLRGLRRPEAILDPLWPNTVELGAGAAVLDALFSTATPADEDVLARMAAIRAAAAESDDVSG